MKYESYKRHLVSNLEGKSLCDKYCELIPIAFWLWEEYDQDIICPECLEILPLQLLAALE